MKGAARRLRLLWNSAKLLGVVRELSKMAGGLAGLAKWSQLEDYYLAQIARAVRECGLCDSKDGFVRLLKHILSERGWSCEDPPQIKRPGKLSTGFAEYESFLEWTLNHACELAAGRRPNPNESRALYAGLLTSTPYVAYRIALYTGLRIPREGKVLLVGAGVQEPLDYLAACKRAESEGWGRCDFAAVEVDPDAYARLRELGDAYGFRTYLGWDSIQERFNAAVVQSVLHWATDPVGLLKTVRQFADKMYLVQSVLEGASTSFLFTYAIGATWPVSYSELLGYIEAAGWRAVKIYSKMPLFVGAFSARHVRTP